MYSYGKNNFSVLRNIGSVFFTGFLLLLLGIFAANAKRYMQIFLDGISLWALCVLPSSLPFLFLTALLTNSGGMRKLSKLCSPVTRFLFGLSGESGYCLLMSFVCGYPIGARVLSDISDMGGVYKHELNKMSVLCSSSGPLFMLGSVGTGMFKDSKIGCIILLSHYLAIILSGIVLRFIPTHEKSAKLGHTPLVPQKSENILQESMYRSVISALCVGGFVSIFYMLSILCMDMGWLTPFAELMGKIFQNSDMGMGFCRGLIEMTGGCSALSTWSSPLSISLCTFLITLGGVSILVQQICYLQNIGVNIPYFIGIKLVQAVTAFALCYALVRIT